MSLASNITRRSGSSRYYARQWVPKELQGILKKSEGWKSLGTSDPKEAKRVARIVLQQWEREFAVLLAKRRLSEHELQSAIWNRYSELVKADEQKRLELATEADQDEIWRVLAGEFGDQDLTAWRILEGIATEHETDKEMRGERLATLKLESGKGETKSVAELMGEIANARSLSIPAGSLDERKLAHGLQRAEIAALHVSAERDLGNFAISPTDPLVKPATSAAPLVAGPGESIMELFEVFAKRNPKKVRPATMTQSRTVVDLFSQFVGRHFPASRISKKEVREWTAALEHYPVKATETALFRDMDFNQTVAENRKIQRKAISEKTFNRYLAALGSFCKWLMMQGHLDSVPTSGMFLTIDKSIQKVFPYTAEQLKKIFQSPLFAGCQGDGKEHEPGNVLIRDHRYWLPLMSLYSGARLGELCQLLVGDIQKLKAHWVLRISLEDDPTKHLKNKGSQRIVPIHPMLIKLGILDIHKRQRLANGKWFFPEIQPDSRDNRAGRYSDFYGDYLRHIGVKADKRINFHSFRHSFTDALRNAGHLDNEFAFLIGHTQKNVTGRYGMVQEGDLVRRVKLIKSVKYLRLNLSALNVHS